MNAMPPDVIHVTPEEMDRAAVVLADIAPHSLPLIRAARQGLLGLAAMQRGVAPPRRLIEQATRPLCVLIGDDDDAATGPAAWPGARWLSYWARAAIVHAAGGKPEHYTMAVAGALAHSRLLLVETSTEFEGAWCRLLGEGRRCPLLRIVPHNGHQHPAPRDPGSLQ
jgi:hypothetical protein